MEGFYRRIEVWKHTEQNAPAKSMESTKYTWDSGFKPIAKYNDMKTVVVKGDLIDTGKAFLKYNPVVLNLADDSFPGGCVYTGSNAAEESLFRRTNYFRTLIMNFYPIKNEEAVYSPAVTVFKHGDEHDYIECPPYQMCFIACPGLRHPIITEDGKMKEADVAILEKKIELILQIAAKNSHEVVVLGALGCGAWKNPPHDVASAFKRVLDKWQGVFRAVVFAIKENVESGYVTRLDSQRADNYSTFKHVLEDRYNEI